MRLRIEGGVPLTGVVHVPADKSIVHRALMVSALVDGTSHIRAVAPGGDVRSTARVLKLLGVSIHETSYGWTVEGRGCAALHVPGEPLDCGNSGTTIRMMTGLLVGAGISATLMGDASLSGRPMRRVCAPLRKLGAEIVSNECEGKEYPPLILKKSSFRGGEIHLDIASAQVKSALILAGVAAQKPVIVQEPALSRDHTERLLGALGAAIHSDGARQPKVTFQPGGVLRPYDLTVPGDFSSAAFLLSLGVMIPNSKISVTGVGVNATRTGFLEILEELRAAIRVTEWHEATGEPVGTITSETSAMDARQAGDQPTRIAGATIPTLIDELVVLGAVATQAQGTTEIHDAQELRVKESDRIKETVALLQSFGGQAQELSDGFVVRGPTPLQATRVDVHKDHRLAMTAAVLACAATGESTLENFDIADISYPGFVGTLEQLGARVRLEKE